MVAAVHVAAKYDISLSTTVKMHVNIMNMVCDQDWTAQAEFEDVEDESKDDDEEVVIDVENPPAKKPRKV